MKKLLWLLFVGLFFLSACDKKEEARTLANEEFISSQVSVAGPKKNKNKGSDRKKEESVESNIEKTITKDLLNGRKPATIEVKKKYSASGQCFIKVVLLRNENFKFESENQNIYLDFSVLNRDIKKEDTKDLPAAYKDVKKSQDLYVLLLIDRMIPARTEIVIGEKTNLLTEDEYNQIKNEDPNVDFHLDLRDSYGYIFQSFDVTDLVTSK